MLINIFSDSDKRAKKLSAMRLDRKGNFAPSDRGSESRKYRHDIAIARDGSGSHHARSCNDAA
jgi:hypothetical protein